MPESDSAAVESDAATVRGTDDTVLARDMATVGRGRAHMQVARRSPQISDANRQWFECHNTRTGARLPYTRKQTGIQILAHDDPSRTQIVTTDESKGHRQVGRKQAW